MSSATRLRGPTERAKPPDTVEEFIAPPGGVIAGQAYLLTLESQMSATREALVIASATVGPGARFHAVTGTVEYDKPHEELWTAGDPIYWSAEGGCMTNTPGPPAPVMGIAPRKVGVAERDAPRPSVTGFVTLDQIVVGEPVPTVTSVSPTSAAIGGPDFILYLMGNGFTEASVLLFNGGEEVTTYVSPTELSTIVKPSLASIPLVVPVSVVGATTAVDFAFTAPSRKG